MIVCISAYFAGGGRLAGGRRGPGLGARDGGWHGGRVCGVEVRGIRVGGEVFAECAELRLELCVVHFRHAVRARHDLLHLIRLVHQVLHLVLQVLRSRRGAEEKLIRREWARQKEQKISLLSTRNVPRLCRCPHS